jgi:acyl-coenzyme A synthetase/AMP-(fatty) acid ligase
MSINEMNTFNSLYDNFVKTHSHNEIFLCCDNRTMTLGELISLSETYILRLHEAGVKAGTCVGYTMPNCPEIIALVIALSKMGACIVPVFHMIPDAVKCTIFKNSRASVVITTNVQLASLVSCCNNGSGSPKFVTVDKNDTDVLSLADESISGKRINDIIPEKTDPSLPILISSSSGTTGTPKTVIWNQSNAAALIKASIAMAETVCEDGKTASSIVAFPLASAGVMNLMGFIFAGVRLIFSPDVSPVKFVQLIDQYQPDSMAAPPAYYEGILSLPMLNNIHTGSIKWIYTGMDFLSSSLMTRLNEKFTNIKGLANGYGLIETTNVFMLCITEKTDEQFGPTNLMSVAAGLGNQIEVRDESGKGVAVNETGILYVKGASVVIGYAGNPEETARAFKDGWFNTGDFVRFEGENTISLLGRRKYLIKRGGKSVSPLIVQDHINTLSGVKVSAVVGVPHQLFGEMVWAYVVVKDGFTVELKDIMKHCRAGLVNYMVPDQVRFVADIPKKSGVGKVDFDKMIQNAKEEIAELGGNNG